MQIINQTKIAICGINLDYDLDLILNSNIDYIALIFFKDKNMLDIQTAKQISRLTKRHNKKVIGVFKTELECGCEIMEIAEYCELDVAQIYGDISKNLELNLRDLGVMIWSMTSILSKSKEVYDMAIYNYDEISCIPKELDRLNYGISVNAANLKNALALKPALLSIEVKNTQEIKEIINLSLYGD